MSPHVIMSSTADGSNIRFEIPHLVLVEGGDDQALVAAMIRHEGLDNFQVHNMFGKQSWTDRFGTVAKQLDFRSNVKSVGLVMDADNNPDGAWDSCTAALVNSGLPAPTEPLTLAGATISAAIMIVPSRSERGALEELCLRSFDPQRIACVDGYFACLAEFSTNRGRGKGYAQAYLAGLQSAPRDLAVACHRNMIDMGHPAFDEIRTFVHALVSHDVDTDAMETQETAIDGADPQPSGP